MNPCLNPHSAGKNVEVAPFMRTTKETVEMQLIIQLMKGSSNPKCVNNILI
jgi:hypothetical protein